MRRSFVLVLLLLLALPLSGCRGGAVDEAPDLELRLSFAPTPPIEGPTRIVVDLRDGEGEPVGGARVTLRGDMTHAGMVPVQEELEEESPGRYATSDFEFTMGGDWVLTVEAVLPDGRRMERTRETRVVSAPGSDQER